jgi:hypothetical protein
VRCKKKTVDHSFFFCVFRPTSGKTSFDHRVDIVAKVIFKGNDILTSSGNDNVVVEHDGDGFVDYLTGSE